MECKFTKYNFIENNDYCGFEGTEGIVKELRRAELEEYKNFLISSLKDVWFNAETRMKGRCVDMGYLSHMYSRIDILEGVKKYRGRLREDLLPIGEFSGGDVLCISIRGKNIGKVYQWDHENEVDEGWNKVVTNVLELFEDFLEFVNSLYLVEEDDIDDGLLIKGTSRYSDDFIELTKVIRKS